MSPIKSPSDGPAEAAVSGFCVEVSPLVPGRGVAPHGFFNAWDEPALERSPPAANVPRTVMTSGTERSHVTTVNDLFS